MRSWTDIAQMTASMMKEQSKTVSLMREINLRYRGDYVIPFPDLEEEPELPPLTPMLVGEAVDQLGMRAAQVTPMVRSPALNNDKATGQRSREWAGVRRQAIYASYYASMWDLQRSRAFRQLVAYNTTCLIVLPDFKRRMPMVQVRDPLSVFAERVDPSTPRPPEYVACVTRHSGAWLRAEYPATRQENGGPITKNHTEYDWEMVEWIDCDQIMFGLLGPVMAQGDHIDMRWIGQGIRPTMPLAGPYPQMSEVPVAIMPAQVTLSGVASRIGNMLGMVDVMAKMQGLDFLAQQKAIFPDVYAVGETNGDPTIIGGVWKDGTSGEINLLRDVRSVGQLRTDPSQATTQSIDRLERNYRTGTGLSPMFGGETYGSLRTGRAIDAMTSMSVDPRIIELHKVMANWMPYINQAILSTWRVFWPSQKYTMFTGLPGDLGMVELDCSKHIETLENTVVYPFPGADVVQQTQILGTLLGTKGISRKTFREMHPWIGDPEGEQEYVRSEELEEALLASVVAQIQQGALPLPVLAILHGKLEKGTPLMQAITEAQTEAQELQATPAEPPPEGMMAPPESMPGLAAGPEALTQPLPPETPAAAPVPDVNAMRQLMTQMQAG